MALKVWNLNSPWKVDKENLSRNWIWTLGRLSLWNVDLKELILDTGKALKCWFEDVYRPKEKN